MIKGLKKIVILGSLMLAGGVYTGGEKIENYFNLNEKTPKEFYLADNPELNEEIKLIAKNYFEGDKSYTSFEKTKKQYGEYKRLELEKIIKENKRVERAQFSKPFYLTEDSLNMVMKQSYGEMKKEGKKWPKEFDKRLFRLMLKQESGYNVYAVSPTGYIGLGQEGFSLVETLRQEKWNTEFKDSITGEIDSIAVEKFLFNPVENIKLSLEGLDYMYQFCSKFDPNWKQSDSDIRRKKMLFCYNAGVGTAKDYNFDWTNEKLPKENREYPEIIMNAYHNPQIKVKL